MMRRLDQRGAAAFEFCMVAVFFFTLIFVIFDLGRYAITMQMLRAVASDAARATMIQCYTPQVTQSQSASSCTDVNSYYSSTYLTSVTTIMGLTPTLSASATGSALVISASLPGFSMMTPMWSGLNSTPSASTSIPY